ncbi:MAG: PAS domain-containing protein [Fidelibacterota bacterium]
MNLYLNTILIVTGFFLFMMIYHIILYLKDFEKTINFWVIILLVVSIVFNYLEYTLPQINDLTEYIPYWITLIFIQSAIIIALSWFCYHYSDYQSKIPHWIITIVWVLLPFIRITQDNMLFYSKISGFREVQLPWRETLYFLEGKFILFAYIYWALIILSVGYLFITSIINAKTKSRKNTFIVVTAVYFAFILVDILHRALELDFVHLTPFANLTIPMIISLSIHNQLVQTRELQTKLKIQKERLDLAITGTGVGLWDWELSPEKVTINNYWAEMLGYQFDELQPMSFQTWENLVHPEDLPKAKKSINDHIAGINDRFRAEFRMRHKTGKWLWILATGKVVQRNKAGKPTRLAGTHLNIDKLKTTEMELTKEKTLLKGINDAIPIGIILIGPDNNLLFSNKAFHEISGYDFKEIEDLNNWFLKAYPDEKYRKAVLEDWQLASSENRSNIVFKIHCKNNQIKDINFKSVVLPGEKILVTLEDISEKRKKEKEIKEVRDLLNTAMEQVPVGIIIADAPDRKIRIANKTALKISNIDYGNLKETDHPLTPNIFYPDGKVYKEEDLPLSRAISEGLYTQDKEMIIIDKNNEKHWVQANAAPVYDSRGKVIAGIIVFSDITSHKLMEEDLKKTRNHITNIINSMPSALVGVDKDMKVTHWNYHAEKRTDISKETAVDSQLDKLLPAFNILQQKIKLSIATKTIQTIPRQRRKRKEKEMIEDILIFPLASNGVEGAVIRIDDVTEKVHMEEMMIQSEKMLSIGGLAAGMAHEINNPLAGMMQNAAVLLNRMTSDSPKNREIAEKLGIEFEKIKQFMFERNVIKQLELINKSGQRASELVSNMLSFARKSESKVKPSDLRKIMDKTLDLAKNDYNMKKHYDFKKIAIIKEYQEDLPLILCEETKIQQVFLNILKNGAEAMSGGLETGTDPKFFIRIFRDNNLVRIEVENNGPRITSENRKKIFEPFFTTKGIGKGTGLGLSVSYFIITKNHNGAMWVESENSNPKFIIELPFAG